MHYRRLGRSGLHVSAITLGCMSWGDPAQIDPGRGDHSWVMDEGGARRVIAAALDAGINVFDTANVYASGTSEEITGRLLGEMARREDVVIATKVFFPMRHGPNEGGLSRHAILTQAEASLRRLGTDHIDIYQVHRWDPHTPIEETMEALDDLVRAGKVRYVGASSMAAWQFSKAQYTADAGGWTRFISMQNHYNLLYREEEREMLPLCADLGVGVMPWSPLARGRLTRDRGAMTARTTSDVLGTDLYPSDDAKIIDGVAEVARKRRISKAQVALAWLLAQETVTSPIVGVSRPEQLTDALAAVDLSLEGEDLVALEEHYTPRAIAGHQ